MSENINPNVALRMVVDGKTRDITFQELTLSNNLSQEALVSLLIKKKLIEPQELLDEIKRLQEARYQSMPDQQDK